MVKKRCDYIDFMILKLISRSVFLNFAQIRLKTCFQEKQVFFGHPIQLILSEGFSMRGGGENKAGEEVELSFEPPLRRVKSARVGPGCWRTCSGHHSSPLLTLLRGVPGFSFPSFFPSFFSSFFFSFLSSSLFSLFLLLLSLIFSAS